MPKVSITGAFSYSGAYIAEAFLDAGWQVRTLTRNPLRPHRLQGKIEALLLNFDQPGEMQNNLAGADVLVNTYWVRFDHGSSTFAQAIKNSATLFSSAHRAGAKRIVHLSVSNAELDAPLPYYAGKAKVEEILKRAGPSYSILRPTLIFGEEELLLNNIAWLLRKLPIFVIPGDGSYRIQPIFVKDLAQLALRESTEKGTRLINAAGPQVLRYSEIIQLLMQAVGSRARIMYSHPRSAILLARLLGLFLNDVLLTQDELDGLIQERLFVGPDHIDGIRFSDWAANNAHLLGSHYSNELSRHHQAPTH